MTTIIQVTYTNLTVYIEKLHELQAEMILGLDCDTRYEIHFEDDVLVIQAADMRNELAMLHKLDKLISKLKEIEKRQFYYDLSKETLMTILSIDSSKRVAYIKDMLEYGVILPDSGSTCDIYRWVMKYIK